VSADRIAQKTAGEKPEIGMVVPASPIGVFDSGVGGLTVLKEVIRQLPNEDVIYLADTARVPYGGRQPEEIVKINEEILPYLIDQGAKLIIVACGTSSAIAYPVLKDKYKVQMISMIEPGARAAVAASRTGSIGLMATVGTVNSGAYQSAVGALKKDAKVTAVACPLFVPLIEGGFIDSDETKKVVKDYLKPLLKENIDALILGCTHYPHLARAIGEKAGLNVVLVDPAEAAVSDAKQILQRAGTLKDKKLPPKYKYLVTGSVLQFQEVGSRLLGRPITHAKHVII